MRRAVAPRTRALLQREIEASDRERRRLATDLHNGVIQDMAGLSMALTAARRHASARRRGAAERLARSPSTARRTTRTLRQALVDIYPPNLQRAGLRTAVDDLLDGGAAEVAAALDDELDALAARHRRARLPDGAGGRAQRRRPRRRHRLDLRIERSRRRVARRRQPTTAAASSRTRRAGHLGLALITDLVEPGRRRADRGLRARRRHRVRALVPVVIGVLIVDDHPALRAGLEPMLEASDDLTSSAARRAGARA